MASFLPSIDKAILFDLLARRVRHRELRWLTATLLFHGPTADYRFRSLNHSIRGLRPRAEPVPVARGIDFVGWKTWWSHRVPRRRTGWRYEARWSQWSSRPSGFAAAYRWWLRRLPDGALLFLRVGRFVEFYGPQRLLAERVLGLRQAMLQRAGYAIAAGFPTSSAPRLALRALTAGMSVVLVGTRDTPPSVSMVVPSAEGRGAADAVALRLWDR